MFFPEGWKCSHVTGSQLNVVVLLHIFKHVYELVVCAEIIVKVGLVIQVRPLSRKQKIHCLLFYGYVILWNSWLVISFRICSNALLRFIINYQFAVHPINCCVEIDSLYLYERRRLCDVNYM